MRARIRWCVLAADVSPGRPLLRRVLLLLLLCVSGPHAYSARAAAARHRCVCGGGSVPVAPYQMRSRTLRLAAPAGRPTAAPLAAFPAAATAVSSPGSCMKAYESTVPKATYRLRRSFSKLWTLLAGTSMLGTSPSSHSANSLGSAAPEMSAMAKTTAPKKAATKGPQPTEASTGLASVPLFTKPFRPTSPPGNPPTSPPKSLDRSAYCGSCAPPASASPVTALTGAATDCFAFSASRSSHSPFSPPAQPPVSSVREG
mmetsp:Transcript_19723/g.67145  ORF Transcript_19723/g.67145 Transcript_19723/m.67145 type:complete len:258 (-) Transcript_19723:187-960(-)